MGLKADLWKVVLRFGAYFWKVGLFIEDEFGLSE